MIDQEILEKYKLSRMSDADSEQLSLLDEKIEAARAIARSSSSDLRTALQKMGEIMRCYDQKAEIYIRHSRQMRARWTL